MADKPPDESVRTLYSSFPSQENIKKISDSKSPVRYVSTDNETTQISINIDSLANNEIHTIAKDSLKIKIIRQETQDPELIKLKIVVPKGSTYNYEHGDEQEAVEQARVFEPKDFSVVPNDFAAFANSLVNVGSIEFSTGDFVSSSPIPQLDEEDESVSNYITCDVIISQSQLNLKEETLYNSRDSSNKNKGAKLFESKLKTEIEEKISFHAIVETKENDLKKDCVFEVNLENRQYSESHITFDDFTRHSVDTCDSKYIKPEQLFIVHPLRKDGPKKDKEKSTKHVHSVPIMGKSALMAKSKVVEEKPHTVTSNDTEIIQELVTQRFSTVLEAYHQRSLKRKAMRAKRLICNGEYVGPSEESPNQEHQVNSETDPALHKNKAESTSDNGFVSGGSSPRMDDKQPNIEISPASSLSSSPDADTGALKQPPILFRSVSCGNPKFDAKECDNQCLSAEEWADYNSSMTSCQSRNFGELLDSYDPRKFLIDALGNELDTSDTVFEEVSFCFLINRNLQMI